MNNLAAGWIPWKQGDKAPEGTHSVLVVCPDGKPYFDCMTFDGEQWHCLSGTDDGSFVQAYKVVNRDVNVDDVWSAVQRHNKLMELKATKLALEGKLAAQQAEMDDTLKEMLTTVMKIHAAEEGF